MLRIIPIITISLIAQVAVAQNDVSKAYLGRVNQLLSNTHILIAKAREYDNKKLRYRFDYQKLEADIQAIQSGIGDYINERQIEPNTIKPIVANYGGNHE